MPKNHLKTIAAPKSWHIERKANTFIMRPLPGAHRLDNSMPLSIVMRELLKVAKTAKEAKQILHLKDVFVDKRKRLEEKMSVGFMDVIEFPQIEKQFRILLDVKGYIIAVEIDDKEGNVKLSRIVGKNKIAGGKTQLNTHDGRSLIVDKDSYKVGDTLEITLPDQQIKTHVKLEKGASVMLVGGSHIGVVGVVEDILDKKIIIKSKKSKFETMKDCAFVVGKDKPLLECIKKLEK